MSTTIDGVGVWTFLDNFSAPEAAQFAQRIEALGYTALWLPEAVSRDPFVLISYMAAQTKKLVFCTGIANIYARDPLTMKSIRMTLGDVAPGRFVLGLGVSHMHLVQKVRGHTYSTKPVTTMREYLDAMDKVRYFGPKPAEEPPMVLAALRQNMLKLAAERTRGAHPYFVPPEHTRRARQILGPDAWLCPEQMLVLDTDATRARAVARKQMAVYLGLPNYQNNLREFGFGDDDFANGGSDRLVDAITAWGDETALRERIKEHFDAGANHVCIQPFRNDGQAGPSMEILERLAPARR
jgi:probable F420-dependent oxidoreductase